MRKYCAANKQYFNEYIYQRLNSINLNLNYRIVLFQ